MSIDIVKLAEIIGACSVVLGTVIGGYKFYDKLVDRLSELESRVDLLERENRDIKGENEIVIFSLRACLDGLHQKGCNGKVTEAMERIDNHLNKAAHH